MNHQHHMSSNESIWVMSIAMILAGLFSGMNAFVNKVEDIRFNINDLYMSFMMIGGMFFFMSIYYQSRKMLLFGIIMIILSLILIRNQWFVNQTNFVRSMIPHHSMAIMMSRKYLEKEEKRRSDPLNDLLRKIIQTQEDEIAYMKEIK